MTPEQIDAFIAGKPLHYTSISGAPCIAKFKRTQHGISYMEITTLGCRLVSSQIIGEKAAREFALNIDRVPE